MSNKIPISVLYIHVLLYWLLTKTIGHVLLFTNAYYRLFLNFGIGLKKSRYEFEREFNVS